MKKFRRVRWFCLPVRRKPVLLVYPSGYRYVVHPRHVWMHHWQLEELHVVWRYTHLKRDK